MEVDEGTSARTGSRVSVNRIPRIGMRPRQIKMRLGLVVVARVEAQPIGRPDSAMMDIGDAQAAARSTMRRTADMSMSGMPRQ